MRKTEGTFVANIFSLGFQLAMKRKLWNSGWSVDVLRALIGNIIGSRPNYWSRLKWRRLSLKFGVPASWLVLTEKWSENLTNTIPHLLRKTQGVLESRVEN
jgi:hypothetical protein